MDKKVLKMLNILTDEHVYSLNKLKIKLEKESLILNDKEIIDLIILTLFESVCYFKLEKKYNEKILYKCFKYLNASNNSKYIDSSNVELLKRTIDKIDKKIISKTNNLNKICRDNIQFLLKIKYNIELTLVQFDVKKQIIDDKEHIEEVLYNLIFNVKNYNYVVEIFKTYPELINFKNHCNKYILDDVITNYINLLNIDTNGFDIIYYEKIINLFLDDEKFNLTKNYRDNLINRLLMAKNNLMNNNYSRRKNRKIRFFINDVIDKLNNIEITEQEKFFTNINYRYGIQDSFNGNYYDKFKATNNIVINEEIIDLTDRYTFTVDSLETKTYDDAFSLIKKSDGTYELDVYISDITKYIIENSKLDELAKKKAATIYLPNYTLTMLPHSLTYNNCSLIKDNYRNVIAHRFIFSKNFDIISFNVEEAIIKVDDNFCYDDILSVLVDDDIEKLKTISTIIDISNNIKRNNFYNTDYHIIKSLKKKYDNPDEKLLEKYRNSHTNFVDAILILTNYFVSDLFKRLDFPFIYRVNSSDLNLNLVSNLNKVDENEISKQIIDHINELYKPSYYSNVNLGHKALNLDSYCHVTTPIRNYAALLSQRLEYKYLINSDKITDKMIYEDEKNISDVVHYINDRIYYNDEYCLEYKQKILKK